MNSGHRMVERQDNTVEGRVSREGDLILSLLRGSDYGQMGGSVAKKAYSSFTGHPEGGSQLLVTPAPAGIQCPLLVFTATQTHTACNCTYRHTHTRTHTDSTVKCRSEWNACLNKPLFWVGFSHPNLRLAPALYSFLRSSVPTPPAVGQCRGGWLSFYTKT